MCPVSDCLPVYSKPFTIPIVIPRSRRKEFAPPCSGIGFQHQPESFSEAGILPQTGHYAPQRFFSEVDERQPQAVMEILRPRHRERRPLAEMVLDDHLWHDEQFVA